MVEIFKGFGLLLIALAGFGLLGAFWGAVVERNPGLFPVVELLAVAGIAILGFGYWLDRREKLAAGRPSELLPVIPQVFSGVILALQMAFVLVAIPFTFATAAQVFAALSGSGTISSGPPLGMVISISLVVFARRARRKLLRAKK